MESTEEILTKYREYLGESENKEITKKLEEFVETLHSKNIPVKSPNLTSIASYYLSLFKKGKFQISSFFKSTNITPENIAESVRGFENAGKREFEHIRYFLFSPKSEQNTEIRYYNKKVFIPTNMQNYSTKPIIIKTIHPTRPAFFGELTKENKEQYINLELNPPKNLVELAEHLSQITKQSIEYDIDNIKYKKEFKEKDPQLIKKAKQSYIVPKHPDKKGKCVDQGNRFRQSLQAIGLPSNIKYTKISCDRGNIYHDLTLIMDTDSKQWFLVNSLSPTLNFDVIEKENISEIGRIY